MRSRTVIYLAIVLLNVIGVRASATTQQELKARVVSATKDLKDISMIGTVVESNKDIVEKVDASYARLYELKSARISLKAPDKLRIEGKLGMVKFEYIIAGGMKITRAPMLRFKKKEDYSSDPAKLQGPFDMGLVTPSLWENRRVEILDDPECKLNSEIMLKLRWLKGDMYYLAWVDEQNLWLKRIEKRDGEGKLRVRMVYSNPKNIGGVIWMPTTAEMYAPDGAKAGKTEISDIKFNVGMPDSMFE